MPALNAALRPGARRPILRSTRTIARLSGALISLPLSLALLLSVSTAGHADNSLTLELPPSAEAVAQRAAEHARQAADAAAQRTAARALEAPHQATTQPVRQRAMASRQMTRSAYASRGQSGGSERVVGRLGQVERPTTIYRTQTSRAAHLSTAPAGTYLAIQSESGNWYGILMSDGTLGWVHRQNLHLLDYQVVSDGTVPQPQAGTALGNYSDGLPSSRGIYFQGDTQALFREAYRYLGVPYHWGGNGADGIDCSAFVKNVFQACGYSLPRHSSDQTAYGLAVPKEQLMPGDRLYFGNAASRNITHTGLYLGSGYFIHASSNAHGVAISQINEPLYDRMYICARR